jgi:hypothetical protein
MEKFKAGFIASIGLLMVVYAISSMYKGSVFLGGGIKGSTYDRQSSPVSFWLVCFFWLCFGLYACRAAWKLI